MGFKMIKRKKALILAVLSGLCAVGFTACKEKEIPHDHVWLGWEEVLPASCTSAGLEMRYCAGDETHYEEREIPATGHHPKQWFASENGHVGFCDDCGQETAEEEHEFKNGVCVQCGEENY
jgi:hypothetical protein